MARHVAATETATGTAMTIGVVTDVVTTMAGAAFIAVPGMVAAVADATMIDLTGPILAVTDTRIVLLSIAMLHETIATEAAGVGEENTMIVTLDVGPLLPTLNPLAAKSMAVAGLTTALTIGLLVVELQS